MTNVLSPFSHMYNDIIIAPQPIVYGVSMNQMFILHYYVIDAYMSLFQRNSNY